MDVKDWKFDKDHVKSWAEEGKKAGVFVVGAFGVAEKGVMEMLLTVAHIIAGTPSAEDFLTGYATAWSNPDTGKSRKADARAVFEAFSMKDASGKLIDAYERTVGYEENKDGTRKLDAQKNSIPIKETKSAQEWLTEYEGDFKGFLALAREIRNQGSGRNSQGTTVNRRQKITDKQLTSIMEALPVASPKQAEAIITDLTNKVVAKLPSGESEKMVLAQMEMLANQLKVSKQPIYQNAGAAIIDILDELRTEVRAAAELQKQAAKDTLPQGAAAEGDVKAPVPAQQEQKAA